MCERLSEPLESAATPSRKEFRHTKNIPKICKKYTKIYPNTFKMNTKYQGRPGPSPARPGVRGRAVPIRPVRGLGLGPRLGRAWAGRGRPWYFVFILDISWIYLLICLYMFCIYFFFCYIFCYIKEEFRVSIKKQPDEALGVDIQPDADKLRILKIKETFNLIK